MSIRRRFDFNRLGVEMHDLAAELFPICRSITGPGVRQTLAIIQDYLPIQVHEVPSGTTVFDWTIPREWSIRDAYIQGPDGEKVVDFRESNLHVVNYSVPVDEVLSLDELQPHLHSLPDQPDAVPYLTSYYQDRWGFCLTHRRREQLPNGEYRVVIDSDLRDGSLSFADLVIPGELDGEVLLSTYVCHPSMANNELSGPVVATALGQWIMQEPRRYTYRLVFAPETIGALTYLHHHLHHLRTKVVAAFNLTCMGDDRTYSYLPSRTGDTLADRVALATLSERYAPFNEYSFLDRGSDERQYCSPGVDLPMVSVMRTKYGEFPEYHTSLDDLELVTPEGLLGGFSVVRDCLALLERNATYRTTTIGEPRLSKHGLHSGLGARQADPTVRELLDILAYADGTRDVIDLSATTQIPIGRLCELVELLSKKGLLDDCGVSRRCAQGADPTDSS